MREANPLEHPLRGLSLVEASAGTGKTMLLVRLYLRALLVEGLSVEQILAVTYTRAATGELSVRIRRALTEAREQLKETLSDSSFPRKRESSDFLLRLIECADDDRQLLVKRTDAALAAFDEKAVFTIHGFCQRTLADHAFEAAASFANEQSEDEDALRTEIAADFWRRRTGTGEPAYVEWFIATFKSPDQLLRKTLGKALQVSGPLAVEPAVDAAARRNAETAFDRAAGAAGEAWHAEAAALRAWFLDGENLKSNMYPREGMEILLDAWQTWLSQPPNPLLPANFERFTVAKLLGRGDQYKTGGLKKGKQLLSCRFLDEDLGGRLREATDRVQRLWWQETVAAALEFVWSESRARKRKMRERGFDDMLRDLRDALAAPGGKALARRIARRYSLILVDEFQDTDPLQHEIFTAIHAADKGHGLVLIGDPKQAIYRFRGADVFTYLQARRICKKTERLFSLTHNYRSAKPLLTVINELFGGASDPFEYPEIPYLPVTSGREPPLSALAMPRGDDAPTTIVWDAALDGGTSTKGDAESRAARICAGEIARLLRLGRAGAASLDGAALQAKDIAVLVNKNAQGLLMQEALRRRGIASAMVATESVFAGREAEELETVLGAIAEPANGRLLRRALATRLLGVTAAELAARAQDEAGWGETVGRFRAYYGLWQNEGIAAMLARLFRDEGVIERMLECGDGERAMTNLRHLAELAGAEAVRRPGIAPLLAWFGAARDEGAPQESRQLRLESDENLVRIATIHKAKGLQYPVVFLPFLWDGKKPKRQAGAVLAHDEKYHAVLDLGSDALVERNSEAGREQRAEDVRKTYVALTRAERACYVIALPVNQVELSAFGRLLQVNKAEEFHAGLNRWAGRAAAEIKLRPPAGGTGAGAEDLARARGEARDFPYPERLHQRFHIASYSRLVANARGGAAEVPDWDEAVIAPPPVEAAQGIHAFPAGAASGTFLHAVIEALDFAADAPTIAATVHNKLAAHGFDGKWGDTLTRWLADLFKTPLDAPGCSLSDIGAAQRVNEMEFHFLLNRIEEAALDRAVAGFAPNVSRPELHFDAVAGQMKGYLDLVFEHDGRFWIADYKSNRLGSDLAAYTPEALDRAMAEHRYDLQYLIYTVAVHRYLKTRIADYDYERHFGGVLYLFLRGMAPEAPAPRGVWYSRPAYADIERLDAYLVEEQQ